MQGFFSLPFLAPGGSGGQLRTTEGFFPPSYQLLFKLLSLGLEMGLVGSGIRARSNAVNVLQQSEEMLMDIVKKKGKPCCLLGRC